ncbi:MAG: serine hydrolase [Nocardioidaceae bacterium]
MSGRQGQISVAAYDSTTGTTFVSNRGLRAYTASILKVSLLVEALRARADGRAGVAAAITAHAPSMIEYSDNDATTRLWQATGAAAGLTEFFKTAGLDQTRSAPVLLEPWDGVTTTATDQLSLLRALASHSQLLSRADVAYALGLMQHVSADQRWGVGLAARNPDTALVAVKDGWVPVPGDGWTVNSIGVVWRRGGGYYCLAVLSTGQPSMAYGIVSDESAVAAVDSVLP